MQVRTRILRLRPVVNRIPSRCTPPSARLRYETILYSPEANADIFDDSEMLYFCIVTTVIIPFISMPLQPERRRHFSAETRELQIHTKDGCFLCRVVYINAH